MPLHNGTDTLYADTMTRLVRHHDKGRDRSPHRLRQLDVEALLGLPKPDLRLLSGGMIQQKCQIRRAAHKDPPVAAGCQSIAEGC